MTAQDFAIYAGAIVAGVPIIGGFVLQCLTYRRQSMRDEKLTTIEHKVNGLTEHAVSIALRAGTAEGHAQGVADERADPQSPATAPPA